jgi:hypothetical protein
VPLAELTDGERLLSLLPSPPWGRGTEGEGAAAAVVLAVTLSRVTQPVYNIEVHGEHVYQVGELGVLVHNAGCLNDLAKISDTAMVNFGSIARAVVHPPGGRSYWFKWRDVKHLTPRQLQTVIGDMASAGLDEGMKFIRVASPTTIFIKRPPSNGAGITEYISDIAVEILSNIRLP